MKALLKLNVVLIITGLWVAFAPSLRAAGTGTVIYNNSTNDQFTRFEIPANLEVGDQIKLVSTERMLTFFSFEYWGTNTAQPDNSSFAGNVKARVRFYENNGDPFSGYLAPGTNFFDSGWFSVPQPTDRNTFSFWAGTGMDFPGGGLFIPVDEMTWSVEFTGMGGTDSVGLDIYSPPVVGQNYDDYWEYSGSGWSLKTNSLSSNMSFGSYMEAIVPEPSAITLSLVGGLSLLVLGRRFRQKE